MYPFMILLSVTFCADTDNHTVVVHQYSWVLTVLLLALWSISSRLEITPSSFSMLALFQSRFIQTITSVWELLTQTTINRPDLMFSNNLCLCRIYIVWSGCSASRIIESLFNITVTGAWSLNLCNRSKQGFIAFRKNKNTDADCVPANKWLNIISHQNDCYFFVVFLSL